MTALLSETLDLTAYVEDCGCGYAYEIEAEKNTDDLYTVIAYVGCYGYNKYTDLSAQKAKNKILGSIAYFGATISQEEVDVFLRKIFVQS